MGSNGGTKFGDFLDRALDRLSSYIGLIFGGHKAVEQVLEESREWYVVQHTPRGDESKDQTYQGPYKFTFTGLAEDYELLRAALESKSPGLFEISYAGRTGSTRLRPHDKFGLS